VAENLCHLAGCSDGPWLSAAPACRGVGCFRLVGFEADLLIVIRVVSVLGLCTGRSGGGTDAEILMLRHQPSLWPSATILRSFAFDVAGRRGWRCLRGRCGGAPGGDASDRRSRQILRWQRESSAAVSHRPAPGARRRIAGCGRCGAAAGPGRNDHGDTADSTASAGVGITCAVHGLADPQERRDPTGLRAGWPGW